jgi:hypothetical protein
MSDSIISHLITVIGPVFLCAGAGYAIARFKQPFDSKIITSVVTNITMPALVVSHLAAKHVEFAAFAKLMLAAALAVAAMGIIASIFLYFLKLPLRVYSGAMMLSNVGNIGLPACTLAFGAEGLAYALAFWVVVVVGVFTVGEWIPQGTLSIRRLVSSPSIYSVVIGLVLMITGTPLPEMLDDTLTLLGGATIPLMLLTLGYTIALLEPKNISVGAMLAILHIVIVSVVALVLSQLFGFTGIERGVFILQCLMPCSVFAYLMASKHMPERAHEVASLVLISTAMTIVVLPVALAYWI